MVRFRVRFKIRIRVKDRHHRVVVGMVLGTGCCSNQYRLQCSRNLSDLSSILKSNPNPKTGGAEVDIFPFTLCDYCTAVIKYSLYWLLGRDKPLNFRR